MVIYFTLLEVGVWIMRKLTLLVVTGISAILLGVFALHAQANENRPLDPIILRPKTEKPRQSSAKTVTTQSASLSTGSKVTSNSNITPLCSPLEQPAQPTAPQSNEAGLYVSSTQTGYYTVYGSQTSEIISQLYKCSPVTTNEGHYSASTNYVLNWSATYSVTEGSICTVTSPRVNMGIAQTYPQWTAQATTNPRTTTQWHEFITNLITHENGHANIDKQYAQQLFDMLSTQPQAECATLQQTVNQKAQQIIASLDQANVDYDTQTKHGATQGAVL